MQATNCFRMDIPLSRSRQATTYLCYSCPRMVHMILLDYERGNVNRLRAELSIAEAQELRDQLSYLIEQAADGNGSLG